MTTHHSGPVRPDQLRVVPANEASWADLLAIFGTTDYPGHCYCQAYKVRDCDWAAVAVDSRRDSLRNGTNCGDPAAASTTGLVGYLEDEPVGWVAVEPRIAYPRLLRTRTVWSGRDEDKADEGVWAVTCFVTRRGYRGRGITYGLAAAAVDYARDRGAAALEGYGMLTEPGREITWGELHHGAVQVFEAAGLRPVSQPSKRRVVMRIDFA